MEQFRKMRVVLHVFDGRKTMGGSRGVGDRESGRTHPGKSQVAIVVLRNTETDPLEKQLGQSGPIAS